MAHTLAQKGPLVRDIHHSGTYGTASHTSKLRFPFTGIPPRFEHTFVIYGLFPLSSSDSSRHDGKQSRLTPIQALSNLDEFHITGRGNSLMTA